MALTDGQRRGQKILLFAALMGAVLVMNRGRTMWDQPPVIPHPLRVDLQSVHPQVLMALPQIGPARMEAILAEGRKGPFRSIDEVERRVKGIGPAISSQMEPYLRFGSDPSSKP